MIELSVNKLLKLNNTDGILLGVDFGACRNAFSFPQNSTILICYTQFNEQTSQIKH